MKTSKLLFYYFCCFVIISIFISSCMPELDVLTVTGRWNGTVTDVAEISDNSADQCEWLWGNVDFIFEQDDKKIKLKVKSDEHPEIGTNDTFIDGTLTPGEITFTVKGTISLKDETIITQYKFEYFRKSACTDSANLLRKLEGTYVSTKKKGEQIVCKREGGFSAQMVRDTDKPIDNISMSCSELVKSKKS